MRKFLILSMLAMAGCMGSGSHFPSTGAPTGSGNRAGESGGGPTPEAAVGVSYQDVKKIFEKKCASCHNKNSPPAQPDWTNYNIAFSRRDRIMDRAVVKKNMPPGNPLPAAELAVLKKWIEAGAPENGENPVAPNPRPANPTNPPANPPPAVPPTPPPSGMAGVFENNCTGCHASADTVAPLLHGQAAGYLETQLRAFREGSRKDALMEGSMNAIAQSLVEADVKPLTAFIAGLSACAAPAPAPAVGDAAGDARLGKTVAENSSCLACHVAGNEMGAPLLEGQKPGYLVAQLAAFKSGARKSEMMAGIVESLSADDQRNVAAYIGGQRKCP